LLSFVPLAFASWLCVSKILVVTSPYPAGEPRLTRRVVLSLAVSAVTLILLFTVQDAMRRGASGLEMNWARSLAINAIDWCTWGTLAAVVSVIGPSIRLDRSANRALRIAAWSIFCVAACVTQSVATGLMLRHFHLASIGPAGLNPPLGRYLMNWTFQGFGFNMIIFLMIVGAFHAALYYRDLRARQLREADLEARLARAELNVLRMQLQPHFFFNALHTISSLMISDVPTAQRVISALGDLLRSSIDHTAHQEIPLREELAFVARYVDVQKARFRDRLEVHVDVPDTLLDALVPSLVLQPLVENAIRHGIEVHKRGGAICIQACRAGSNIALTVRDDASEAPPTQIVKGVGLSNVEGRLAQLYGSSQSFRAGRSGDGSFEVALTFPLRTA
jgi:two-component sensor histidine kinase